jgi:protein subunit release factor B
MEKERKLLFSQSKDAGDFIVQATKGSGAGGQNRNKRETACRITHPKSGAVGFCQEERYFEVNKRRAFQRCVETNEFQTWLKLETAKKMGKLRDIDEQVNRQLKSIKIEVRDTTGRFVEVKDDYFKNLQKKEGILNEPESKNMC